MIETSVQHCSIGVDVANTFLMGIVSTSTLFINGILFGIIYKLVQKYKAAWTKALSSNQ